MPSKDLSLHQEKRQTVMLTLTQDCNLRCRYCYEPNKSRNFYMSFDIAQKAIAEYMEADNEFKAVEFDFFGGEPMLAFDLIRGLVDDFHSRKWRKGHIFLIGTNGTILTDEMKCWLVKNKDCVWISVSLDGNKLAHDINRSNSYDSVKNNLPFFMKYWSDQPVKMTISAETIPYVADSIIELEELGIFFTANLVYEDIWGTPEQKTELLDIYARQLDRLVEYYVIYDNLFPARIVDVKPEYIIYKDTESGITGNDCVRYCGSGHEMVVVEVDGSRSPCHRFSPWITGKSAPPISQVNHQTEWKPEKCAECHLIKICPVCAGFNWQVNGETGIRTTYHCDAFKLEAQASAKLQALRLLQQRPEDITNLTPEEAYRMKARIDGIIDLAENGN